MVVGRRVPTLFSSMGAPLALPILPTLGVLPSSGQVRHRVVKVRKPVRAPWFRQQLLAISKPSWAVEVPVEDIYRNCQHAEKERERVVWEDHINQLERFYVEEMVDLFHRSKMVAIFHSNPISRSNFRIAWQNGRRIGMELKQYNRRIGKAGLVGTQWENFLHYWFQFPGNLVDQPLLFSPTVEPALLLRYERKVPEFSLLACVVENRILSRAQLVAMQDMPDLATCRAELAGLLAHHQRRTVGLLQAGQQQLTTNLAQLVKDRTEGGSD